MSILGRSSCRKLSPKVTVSLTLTFTDKLVPSSAGGGFAVTVKIAGSPSVIVP